MILNIIIYKLFIHLKSNKALLLLSKIEEEFIFID